MRGLGLLKRGRRLAELRMTETVTIGTFQDATDPTTGDPIREPNVVRYVGPGRVRYSSAATSDSGATGELVVTQEPLLSIPSGAAIVYEGDEVLVTGSVADEAIVGRVYRVSGNPLVGQTTAMRIRLDEVS